MTEKRMELENLLGRLVGILPGVAGYQDKDSGRDTDKAVRLRVAAEMALLERNLKGEKEKLIEKNELFLLPAIDAIVSKVEKLVSLTRSASRGYRPFFDSASDDPERLTRLYTLDLGLFHELKKIGEEVSDLGRRESAEALKKAIKELNRLLDIFEERFSARQKLLREK